MLYLRFDDQWDYASRTITARFDRATVEIPVCTQKYPRMGAFFINRRDEDQWVISPARCIDTGKWFYAKPAAYDSSGVHREFITLLDAPDAINTLLGKLYDI